MSAATPFRSLLVDLPTAGTFSLRAIVFWALVHATYGSVVLLAGYGGSAAAAAGSILGPSVGIVPLVVLLCDIDVRVTREALFLAHLGIGRRHVAAVTLLTAGVAELALRLALGVWGA